MGDLLHGLNLAAGARRPRRFAPLAARAASVAVTR